MGLRYSDGKKVMVEVKKGVGSEGTSHIRRAKVEIPCRKLESFVDERGNKVHFQQQATQVGAITTQAIRLDNKSAALSVVVT